MTEHIKNAIFEFIKNNDGEKDRVDVVSHMGLTANVVYPLIKELIKEDKIKMEMNPTLAEAGKHRLYVVEPNHDKAVEYLVGEAEFRFKVLKVIRFIDKQDSPCTISKIVKFIALDKTKIVNAIMNLQEGKAISFEGKVDDLAKITITEVGNKIFETLSKNDSCPVCQTEMEFTDVDGGIGLRCPKDCDPDMQPFYHHDKCGQKFATAKEYATHNCFQIKWIGGNHEYGSIGKPTFICAKNFITPEHDEPCGIHRADLWCIINGHVCPHLTFGLEPITEQPTSEEPISVIDFIQKAVDLGYSKEQFMEYMGAWWQDYLNAKEKEGSGTDE